MRRKRISGPAAFGTAYLALCLGSGCAAPGPETRASAGFAVYQPGRGPLYLIGEWERHEGPVEKPGSRTGPSPAPTRRPPLATTPLAGPAVSEGTVSYRMRIDVTSVGADLEGLRRLALYAPSIEGFRFPSPSTGGSSADAAPGKGPRRHLPLRARGRHGLRPHPQRAGRPPPRGRSPRAAGPRLRGGGRGGPYPHPRDGGSLRRDRLLPHPRPHRLPPLPVLAQEPRVPGLLHRLHDRPGHLLHPPGTPWPSASCPPRSAPRGRPPPPPPPSTSSSSS
ncbi:MAG: hypothetical protein MZV70_10955 [Desulfobacterales bacterium]|nr:hypothetical protein [Desulfobacterales bacterium]